MNRKHFRSIIPLMISLCCLTLSIDAATLTIKGDRFYMDGIETEIWGIRTASATKDQSITNHLIGQLDSYKEHGVNMVAVYFQGSSGGSYDPFSKDGKTMDAGHRTRMRLIIEECDQRNMIVIVGIFYQMQRGNGVPNLSGWEACKNAVVTVATWLREIEAGNVILNIANEQNSTGHQGQPWERVRHVDDLLSLVRLAKETDPNRIVGCGGYDHEKNIPFGLSPHVDVLLFDTLGPDRQDHSGTLYERFYHAGITNKPMINVEMFGGWTRKFMPFGVYDEEGKQEHFIEIADAANHPGLSVCLHSNPWCQGPADGGEIRYDLGGHGTPDDPGIHWYFDHVQETVYKFR